MLSDLDALAVLINPEDMLDAFERAGKVKAKAWWHDTFLAPDDSYVGESKAGAE